MENENKTPIASNNAGNTINWLEKILALEEKYGIKSILSGFLILFVAIMMGVIAFNPTFLYEKFQAAQAQKHAELNEKRTEASPLIKAELIELRDAIGADRTVLFETHNGGNNLGGLPFLYVDMSYDMPKRGMEKIQDEYKNVSQDRFDFISELYEYTYWFGDIELIKETDMELYYRLERRGVKYVAMLVLYGEDKTLGSIGATFSEIPEIQNNTIKREMLKVGNTIGDLLDVN